MADYIYTVSGKKFYPLNPRIEDIDIEDIAHALSMLARANGHFPSFHSVAQHCIECADEASDRGYGDKVSLACLLHDGAEAYMSDVTTPVKSALSDYGKYEENLIGLIYEKYIGTISDEEKKLVYKVDKDLLYHEFYHYMNIELSEKTQLKSNPDFSLKSHSFVKELYLEKFRHFTQKLWRK